jgi:GNAT superfamily N-acetyltransferase
MDEIASIEHATLAALPPRAQETWNGWLLAFDDGTVGRCHSAAPLRHAAPPAETLAETLAGIEQRYAQAGRATVLRVPELPAFDGLRARLQDAGYVRRKPILVQTGRLAGFDAAGAQLRVELAPSAAPEWEQVFLGEGFDPVDGASRLAILRRGRHSVFASVREGERTVAVGSACFAEGWCGVHGIRTLPSHRGRGLAAAVLAALAAGARERGVQRCFLQVEQGNAPARALYARQGFATAWAYAYWSRQEPGRQRNGPAPGPGSPAS